MRWLIVIFWVFVVAMLVKQFFDSDARRQQEAATAQTHYFFSRPPPAPLILHPATANSDADVKQTLVNVLDDTPNPGSFTYQVTVKNVGGATAKSVQEVVYPFRGGHLGNGHRGFTDGVVGDTDPRAQMSAVLVFPDLSPGQENTQAAVFLADPDINPGLNPNPQISFISAKGP